MKLLRNDLSFIKDKLKFNIKGLRSGLLVLAGESAKGKTFYFKKMQEKAILDKNNQFVFINSLNANDYVPKIINNEFHNKVIFIDNADIIFKNYKLRKIIRESDNQYIITGRILKKYAYDLKDLATLRENKLNEFDLFYVSDN